MYERLGLLSEFDHQDELEELPRAALLCVLRGQVPALHLRDGEVLVVGVGARRTALDSYDEMLYACPSRADLVALNEVEGLADGGVRVYSFKRALLTTT